MEMIFLHHAQRTHAETAADNALSVLDAARARQTNSPTMRSLRRAQNANITIGDHLAARILCFAAEPNTQITARGPFWQKAEIEK
jgi:hypothetical protein